LATAVVACVLGTTHVENIDSAAARTHSIAAAAKHRPCPSGPVRLSGPVFARSRDVVLYNNGLNSLASCYIPTGRRPYLHAGYAVENQTAAGRFAAVSFHYVDCSNDCQDPPPAPPGDGSWSITQVYDVKTGRSIRKCFCENNVLFVSDTGVAAWFLGAGVFVLDSNGTREVGTVGPATLSTLSASLTFVGNTVRWKDLGQVKSAPVQP
jgi:hypothetical protein